MALTVKKSRTIRMEKSGTAADLQATVTREYHIENDDPNPENMDPETVIETAGLPRVGRDVFVTETGAVYPYCLCTSKTADQHPKRLSRWIVKATWKGRITGGSVEPTDPTDLKPQASEKLGEMTRVRYIDRSDSNGGKGDPILTPNGNWYAEPALEKIAARIRTVEQYEPTFSWALNASRKFTTNRRRYAGLNRYYWMITDIDAEQVYITLSNGAEVPFAKMTYEITHNPFTWKDERLLVDTHFKDPANGFKKTEFKEGALRTQNIGFIDIFGLPINFPGTEFPSYDQFIIQRELNWRGFLQL